MIRAENKWYALSFAELQTVTATEGEKASVGTQGYTYTAGVWVADAVTPPPINPGAPDYSKLRRETTAHQRTVLANPAKGAVVVDPWYGTKIMRLTDRSDGTWNHGTYSYWPAPNCDGTIIAFASDGVTKIQRFDPAAFARVGSISRMFAVSKRQLHWEGLMWSRTDPNVVYGWDDAARFRYFSFNLSTGVYSLIFDLQALGYGPNEVIWQPSMSGDDRLIAFSRNDANNGKSQTYGFSVYDRTAGHIVLDDSQLSLPVFDECQIDLSGRFVTYKTDTDGRIYSLSNGAFYLVPDDQNMVGHGDNGYGTMVGFENWGGRVVSFDLATKAVTILWDQNTAMDAPGYNWPQDAHFCMNAAKSAGVCLAEMWDKEGGPHEDRPYSSELVLIKLDGSGVLRVCDHRTKPRPKPDGYNDLPMATITQKGDLILFTSNWGVAGPDDVYACKPGA